MATPSTSSQNSNKEGRKKRKKNEIGSDTHSSDASSSKTYASAGARPKNPKKIMQ